MDYKSEQTGIRKGLAKASKPSVWLYDDLFQEGYRFDDQLSKRFLFVKRSQAKSPEDAAVFVGRNFNEIQKHRGAVLWLHGVPLQGSMFL